MNENILIKKDSYLNIQKNESEGKVNISITVEPVKNKFKPGDIVYSDKNIMIIDKYPNKIHCIAYPEVDEVFAFNCLYINKFGSNFDCDGFRYATEEEKNTLFEMLKKNGKRWNAEKLCIEDTPKHQFKFKTGDKVKIKPEISSDTHYWQFPGFTKEKDSHIGKVLTVSGYNYLWQVEIEGCDYTFSEDWLELDESEEKQHKFKRGDKVRIKNGAPCDSFMLGAVLFGEDLNKYNGRTLTVFGYDLGNLVRVEEGSSYFYEYWLEPAELKVGDWVVAWNCPGQGTLGMLDIIEEVGTPYFVSDKWYMNAVKWVDVYEQLEKLRKENETGRS